MKAYQNDIYIKTVELSKVSDQYKWILHSLRMAIGIPNCEISIISMNSISIQSPEFDKESDGRLVLETWIDKENLDP